MPLDKFVGVRLPTSLVDKAKAIADSEHRTLSNYILTLVARDVASHESAVVAEEQPAYRTTKVTDILKRYDLAKLQKATAIPHNYLVSLIDGSAKLDSHALEMLAPGLSREDVNAIIALLPPDDRTRAQSVLAPA